MQVTINGNSTDLVVETEKTLGELLINLELWLENRGFSVSGLSINGSSIGADALEQLYSMDLEKIEQLDIQASSWVELYHQALQEALKLVQQLQDASFQERQELIKSWSDSVSMRFIMDRDAELGQFLNNACSGQGITFNGLESIILERLGELEDPLQAAQMVHKLLDETIQRMENLPLDLQTGKDRHVIESLQIFTVIMGKFFRLLPLLTFLEIKTDSLKPLLEEIGTILQELLAAYEVKDTVLVGDLAEYEIAPRLRSLQGALAPLIASS
ncbi:hypothetical protein [Gracilinema caldarium]|uniref:Uncharacterized protein n=1 Tax=Gracilinema caldarium (strain ATCC 51460 / DSM 7334 / H1) TaxID=744872 RepID=F8EZ39_GRAC1|nr:hypothetical protein [Gracilinema caldarium]AEJ19270.1 hypothetical protein Spica_1124 [Gracilinema caldarium DSM 7334]